MVSFRLDLLDKRESLVSIDWNRAIGPTVDRPPLVVANGRLCRPVFGILASFSPVSHAQHPRISARSQLAADITHECAYGPHDIELPRHEVPIT